MMRLILCPKSRSGRGRKLWRFWQERLDEAGVSYDCVETKYAGHACELAREANGPVVAVGGDGTINEVINGIMTSGRKKTMGILYSGTSPDFCKFHGLETDKKKAIERLLEGKVKQVDVMQIEYCSEGGNKLRRYYGCSCNIGPGAEVADFANRWRGMLGDTCGTLFGVIKAIAGSKGYKIRLCIDGEEYILKNCYHLILIKNPYIASGLKLNLDILPDDGRCYVAGISANSKLGLLSNLPYLYSGKLSEKKDIFLKRFNEIKVSSPERIDVEYDGDRQGVLPVRVLIIPKGLEIIGVKNA